MLDLWSPSAPRFYQCWCLRVGSHVLSGREADVFLLLERDLNEIDGFRRVEFAETEAWWDPVSLIQNSGLLTCPTLSEITIS